MLVGKRSFLSNVKTRSSAELRVFVRLVKKVILRTCSAIGCEKAFSFDTDKIKSVKLLAPIIEMELLAPVPV